MVTKMREVLVVEEDASHVDEVETPTLIEEDLIPEDVEGVDETTQKKEDSLILFQNVHIPMRNGKI